MARVAAFKQSLLAVIRFFDTLRLTNQALLNRRKITRLEAVTDAGSNWVEVDIGHAGHQRLLVQKRLTLESALPKAASTTVLAISRPRYALVETAHKPANILQALPPLSQCFCLKLPRFLAARVQPQSFDQFRIAWE